jgi:hypothetical protein
MHADSRHNLGRCDGLADIVDATGLQPANDVFGLGQPSHEDDRHGSQAGDQLHAPTGLEPVHRRHDGIHQHDIRRHAIHQSERSGAALCDQHGEAGGIQRVVQHAQRRG